jgi:hypothetical protein
MLPLSSLKVIKKVTRLCGQGSQAWKSLDQANRKGVMEMGETDLSQEGTDNKETTME